MAKRWLKAQAEELLTADDRTRERAEAEGDELGRQLRDEATGQAVVSAVPGLRDLVERQEAGRAAAQARREQARDDELAARPLAGVGLALRGDGLDVSWSGQLPARVEHDEELAMLVVELDALDDAVPMAGDRPLAGWRFVVPDHAGPGTYDLGALVAAREAAGGDVEPTDWCLGYGGWDEALYWTPEVGPGTVEVGPGGRSLAVRMAVAGAWGGPFELVAQVNLPE